MLAGLCLNLSACAGGSASEENLRMSPGAGEPADAGSSDGSFQGQSCSSDLDCPGGLVCQSSSGAMSCVSPDDGRPPEVEGQTSFLTPLASANHLFVLSPDRSTLSIIDAADLSIVTMPLPEEPLAMALLPGGEKLLVLSGRGEALSVVDAVSATPAIHSLSLGRRFTALSLSPEGAFALCWTQDGDLIDAGAEGIVSLVDVLGLAAGQSVTPIERAAGRRHKTVFFRLENQIAVEAAIVGSEEVAILDLRTILDPQAAPLPTRVPLPDAFLDPSTREALPVPGGAQLLIRSFVSTELLALDITSRTFTSITLPSPPTDLDLSIDGKLAVIALRSSDEVRWFPLPAGLTDPALTQSVSITELPAGQVALSPDSRFATVFTTAEASESMAWIELASGQVTIFDRLQKWVREIGISPSGDQAIVLHRPNPDSTVADPYEREVDKDQGYSLVDLQGGFAQLKRTSGLAPAQVVFSPDGLHAGVTVDGLGYGRLDTVDLRTLVTDTLRLASRPAFAGALPALASGEGADRVWVTQDHAVGRISFISLANKEQRTVTGFELNAEVNAP